LRAGTSGSELLFTPRAEAERLAEKVFGPLSCSDKNEQRSSEMISRMSAKAAHVPKGTLSLVAGNVTGGGGKATTTKT
jgi:hypothetical protein